MKKGLLYLFFLIFYGHFPVLAQQSVSIGTTNTNPNAVLWLNSPNQNQALIIPVVTNVAAVASPVAGMVVYDQSANAMYYRNASAWVQLAGAVSVTAGTGISISGSTITNTGDTDAADDITTSTTAAGDLSGTYPAPTVAKLRGVGLAATAPATNQVLQYNGTNWTPATLATGSGSVTSVGLTMPSIFSVTGSPVTSSGSFGVTFASQTAATVLAAPNAAAGVPSFRQLSTADIASGTFGITRGGTGLATTPTNGQLMIGNGTGYSLATLTAGTGITVNNAAGAITINSTGLSNPMTTNGDIIYGGASGAATRLATGTGFLKGGATPAWSSINLTTDVTGTLPLTSGGTGATTAATARTNLGLGPLATLSTVTNTEITDGTIINADVSATAAIAGSKITPNFGAQNIITTGSLSTGALTASGAVTLSSLAGAGTRMVTTDASGVIGSQTIPTTFSTLNVVPKGDGTALTASTLYDNGNVGIGTTTPYNQLTITGPSSSPVGAHQSFVTTADTHPTMQFMNWAHSDLGIYFDSYLSNGNSWTSSSSTSNYAMHKASNLDFQYASGVSAGGAISWSNALSILSTGNVTHNNYTKLGSSGPAIKTMKLTGTTSSSSGGSTTAVLTGVPMSKILSIYASVQYFTTASVPSNYTINPTYEFQHYFYEASGDTYIVIWNKSGNDSNVLGKPFTVYVTYEQ